MTKWYKYSLKEYNLPSKPHTKPSLKSESCRDVHDQKASLVSSQVFVLRFSPVCSLLTGLLRGYTMSVLRTVGEADL